MKNYLIGTVIIFLVVYGVYSMFFKTTNEIGFLGADKAGRQVFIQSLDSFLKQGNISVDSDFNDHNILSRIIIGEPMRTTIRFDMTNPPKALNIEDAGGFLNQPYTLFIDEYKDKITLQDNLEMSKEDFKKEGGREKC